MKKVCSTPAVIILITFITLTGCVTETALSVKIIVIVSLLIICIYTMILFILLKRNSNSAALNKNLQSVLSEKIEELESQNSNISISRRLVQENNLDFEKRIESAIEEIRQKDNVMILNSRLATMGELIGFVGHQWKQNLYAISLYTEGLKNILNHKGILDNDTAKEPLDKIDSSIIEMYNNLNDFSGFVKPKNDIEFFSLTDAVDETLHLMNDFITINSVEVVRDYQDGISLHGFSNELKQVVMNIVKNGVDVFGERNCKERIMVISIHGNDEFNFINIKDNAGGIPLDNPDGVFDKFYTSKDDGTGLGLYLSRLVIEQRFKGKIEVQNIGGGASFTISIPVFTEDTVI